MGCAGRNVVWNKLRFSQIESKMCFSEMTCGRLSTGIQLPAQARPWAAQDWLSMALWPASRKAPKRTSPGDPFQHCRAMLENNSFLTIAASCPVPLQPKARHDIAGSAYNTEEIVMSLNLLLRSDSQNLNLSWSQWLEIICLDSL